MINLKEIPLIVTCEHASNKVPSYLKKYFLDEEFILNTHHAYDLGIEAIFNKAVKKWNPFYSCKGNYSRLCIDLNRSLHHPRLFSKYTNTASTEIKKQLLQEWNSYREPVVKAIQKQLLLAPSKSCFHLSVHSFTPQINGIERNADIGILYDPARSLEKEVALELKKRILEQNPLLKIKMNYPYLGKSDGFATSLRIEFSKGYVGIELEINQKIIDLDFKLPSI